MRKASFGRLNVGQNELPPKIKVWSQEEIKELSDVFQLFDLDHDGLISAEEMLQMFAALSIRATMTDVRNIIAKCDRNGDNMINFEEFRDCMGVRYFADNTDTQLVAMFNRFDHNGDGFITRKELDDTFAALGVQASSADFIKSLESEHQQDKRGISFEDFKRIMNYKDE